MKKRDIAVRGFSANGHDVEEGEDVTERFDSQTRLVLRSMKRIEERDEADTEEVIKKGRNRAVAGTDSDAKGPGVPPLPGAPVVPPLPGSDKA